MIPILYAPDESNFDHGGIGALFETTSCVVEEERNGAFEIEFKYPVDGHLYKYIEEGCIVKAKPNDTADPQLFSIYRSTKPINGIVTFYGEHISYELSGNPVESVEVENAIAQDAIGRVLAAAGRSGAAFSPENVSLDYDDMPVVRNGVDAGTPEAELCEVMNRNEFTIHLNLGEGNGTFTVWTCDISHEYVTINADYHT